MGAGEKLLTTADWAPVIKTIKDPTVLPIAHYCDPTLRYDAWRDEEPAEGDQWVKTTCGAGFAPALLTEPYRVSPTCETRRTPDGVLVMVDATWGGRNGH